MRIISDQHDYYDYYDCVQAQGQDLTCTWVRQLEVCTFVGWPFPKISSGRYYSREEDLQIRQIVVGFCGKIYPMLEVGKNPADDPAICHSFEEVDAFIRANYKKEQVEAYENPKKRHWRKPDIGVWKIKLLEFYEECRQKHASYERIFLENGCPVFIAQRRPISASRSSPTLVFHGRRDRSKPPFIPDVTHIEIDSISRSCGLSDERMLKDLEFYKYFPTQEAFQEIHMYLGGVLGFNNPHVPVPDDKTMRDIKGFNKWSFKKEPTKKRR